MKIYLRESSKNLILYRHMISPLFDYADLMIDNANRSKISRLDKLQEKAVLYINNSSTGNVNVDYLYEKYG